MTTSVARISQAISRSCGPAYRCAHAGFLPQAEQARARLNGDRMFGPRGKPQAKNLSSVISYLQKRAGLSLHVAG